MEDMVYITSSGAERLTKISDELAKAGFGIEFSHADVQKAIADAATEVLSDPEMAIRRKANRFGDWDYTADCNVYIPAKLTIGPATVTEEDDVEEKEELLPDCVVNEALETLRRMN